MKRAAMIVGSFIALASCVNDFDALSSGTAADKNAPEKSAPDPGAGGGDDDDAPAAASGSDPTKACGAQEACTESSSAGVTTFLNSCSGCGCTCKATDCDDAEDDCTSLCQGGASCTGSCGEFRDCKFEVAASRADYTCKTFEDGVCALACTDRSSCTLDCTSSQRCQVTCDDTSECVIKNCKGDGCKVTCKGAKTCGDGSTACNGAACPS